jgi:large conductance mechanosensitive channel
MKKFFAEFKAFALRGNAINLAIGVIIGAAFQKVVSSLTDNMLSPVLGLFLGKDLDKRSITVRGATIAYGAFITAVINFVIMAFVVFLIVKFMNAIAAFGKKEEEATTKKCPYCFSEISVRATRCPECTSELTVGSAAEPPDR